MRVPVRYSRTIAAVITALLIAGTGAIVVSAQADHATPPATTPPATTQTAQSVGEHQTAQPPATTQTAQPAAEHQAAPAAEQKTQPPSSGEHKPAPAAEHTAAAGHEGEAGAAEHGNPLMDTIARLFNFALLAGTLFYLLRSPLALYLKNRSTQVRERLVKAADMRTTAAAEQAAIAEKMRSLPAELDALRKAGAEEVAAEEARIRQAAESERERLLDATRRDISTQLKMAERALMKHAADLAVAVASERVKTTITDADQVRLVDRYLVQVAK